ncbi:hypothetical protein GGR57DRAFT_178993 [Xylariaceae sp. FL1272]|nr:hypothetical protein GGR57DRAFT_178993 [Xylariaceae sp. FL1272]
MTWKLFMTYEGRRRVLRELPLLTEQNLMHPENFTENYIVSSRELPENGEVFRYSITATLPKIGSVYVIGNGRQKALAMKNAHNRLFFESYKSGVLHSWWEPLDDISQDIARNEKDALIDVYQYSIHNGYLPNTSFSFLQRSKTEGVIYVVTSVLPAQGVRVSARAKTMLHAEIIAALKFKKEVLAFQRQKGSISFLEYVAVVQALENGAAPYADSGVQ